MRFRRYTGPFDLMYDIRSYTEFLGPSDYLASLAKIGSSLRLKGYVTPIDDTLFGLELKLFNLEINRRRSEGNFGGGIDPEWSEAIDFAVFIAQSIPHLQPKARHELRQKIFGALKTQGLRSLQHEFRAAAELTYAGADLVFHDLEEGGGFDFLAMKNSVDYEVELKYMPIFSGMAVRPIDVQRFLGELKLKRNSHSCSRVPIVDVILQTRLPANHDQLQALISACNTCAISEERIDLEGIGSVKKLGEVNDAPPELLLQAAQADAFTRGVSVACKTVKPKIVVRIKSQKTWSLRENILSDISTASKQLTGRRPGVIWIHLGFMSREQFRMFAHEKRVFDSIATTVFNSDKRRHIVQVQFSGGEYTETTGKLLHSRFESRLFNSYSTSFSGQLLFPNGADRVDKPVSPYAT